MSPRTGMTFSLSSGARLSQPNILIPRIGLPATRGTLQMLQGQSVRIIGTDNQVQRLDGFDRIYQVENSQIPEICEKEGVDLILPQHDEDALNFAKLGLPVMASPPDVIERAWDKEQLFATLNQPNYQMISSGEELEEAAYALGYPEKDLVLKPPRLWGSRGLCILSERPPKDLFSARSAGTRMPLSLAKQAVHSKLLLMEYLPGPEYSVDAFVGKHAKVAIPRIRKSTIGGVAWETELDYRQDLIDLTLQYAETLGLRSIFGMQFKFDSKGQPRLLECNPRIQGTMIASLYSGVNLLWMAVREALGDPPPQPEGPLKVATYKRSF